jgi:ribosomal protein S18 acetylase RimI-like enzyme
MRACDVKECVDLVVDAFADAVDAKPRAFVLKYLIGLANGDDAEETALVAREIVEDARASGGDDRGDVIGLVTTSISAKTRPLEKDASMAPPNDAAYLANACVAKSTRRRGVGRGLLKAVEALVLEMGGCDVWLHVRADDEAAYALYSGEGYDEVARERAFSLGGLFGGKKTSPRVLMRKSIRTDGSCNFML